MNLGTASPLEIDTVIAELDGKAMQQEELIGKIMISLHYVVRDKQTSRTGWAMTSKEVLAKVQDLLKDERLEYVRFNGSTEDSVRAKLSKLDTAKAEMNRLTDEISRYEDEWRRRPWSRFHQLRSTSNAHVHDSRWCSALHRSNLGDLGWRPDLSGKSMEEAVAELGPYLCSKCFPGAPVKWRQNPADHKAKDPNECLGTNEQPVEGTVQSKPTYRSYTRSGRCPVCLNGQTVRTDGTLSKHSKPKSKVNEITMPDSDQPLKVGSEVLKTVRTAEISYVDDASYVAACKQGYSGTGRLAEATEHADLILKALAAKNGSSVEMERDRLASRVAKKTRLYFGN